MRLLLLALLALAAWRLLRRRETVARWEEPEDGYMGWSIQPV